MRFLCRLFKHQFIIPIFDVDGERIGAYCWRCGAKWSQR